MTPVLRILKDQNCNKYMLTQTCNSIGRHTSNWHPSEEWAMCWGTRGWGEGREVAPGWHHMASGTKSWKGDNYEHKLPNYHWQPFKVFFLFPSLKIILGDIYYGDLNTYSTVEEYKEWPCCPYSAAVKFSTGPVLLPHTAPQQII
jgi:hypothetical protein